MGRILRLLTTALEQSKGAVAATVNGYRSLTFCLATESGMLTIAEVGELSPNASVMLRVSTLTAWAELEVASSRQVYLKEVVGPHRATLAKLWIASLRDFASIRADSEALQESSTAGVDSAYSGLGREVLLPVRQFNSRFTSGRTDVELPVLRGFLDQNSEGTCSSNALE